MDSPANEPVLSAKPSWNIPHQNARGDSGLNDGLWLGRVSLIFLGVGSLGVGCVAPLIWIAWILIFPVTLIACIIAILGIRRHPRSIAGWTTLGISGAIYLSIGIGFAMMEITAN
jgi:hypothetical protein